MIVADEVDPLCHPLSAANKLVFAPGLLAGTAATTSGRLSVGCKSPLTGGIKEANAGGQAGMALGRLGYAAIIVEGQPPGDDLWKILINKEGVSFSVDNSCRGLGNYDTVAKLSKIHGEKCAYMTIGQAGEMKLLAASIACTDRELHPTRHMGRGGVGAVMGAKKIKAIVVDDTGTAPPQSKDPSAFKTAAKACVEGLKRHAVTGQGLPAFGTNVLTNVLNEAGGYPTFNFQEGQFAGASKISGEAQAQLETDRGGLRDARLPARLHHPVLRYLPRQGRQVRHQAARVRDGLVAWRQLRHRRSRRDRPARPDGRRLRRRHDRDGRDHRRRDGGWRHQVR